MENNLISLLAIIFLVLFFLLISYRNLFKKYTSLLKQMHEEKIEEEKNKTVLDEIEKDYSKIIESANKKGKEIITKAFSVKKDSEEELKNALEEFDKYQKEILEKTSTDIIAKYKLKPNNNNINTSINVSEDIEEYRENDIDPFKRIIKEETIVSQAIIEEKAKNEYERIESELNEYKNEKLNEIDENIYQLVKKIVSIAIKNSISIKDNEKMVMEALEKEKMKGEIFNE